MRGEDDDSTEPVDVKPRRRRLPPRQRPPRLLQYDGQVYHGLPLRGQSLVNQKDSVSVSSPSRRNVPFTANQLKNDANMS